MEREHEWERKYGRVLDTRRLEVAKQLVHQWCSGSDWRLSLARQEVDNLQKEIPPKYPFWETLTQLHLNSLVHSPLGTNSFIEVFWNWLNGKSCLMTEQTSTIYEIPAGYRTESFFEVGAFPISCNNLFAPLRPLLTYELLGAYQATTLPISCTDLWRPILWISTWLAHCFFHINA